MSSKFLNEFVTSEKDLMRSINRIPSEYYLLEEDGTLKEKATDKILGELTLEDQQDELDEFFDFVMIDKEEIERKMAGGKEDKFDPEKLAREERAMTATKGELLAARYRDSPK